MAEAIELATPWGWQNIGGRGTMPEDMQRVLATMFEYHPHRSGGSTRAGVYQSLGVKLKADTTIGVYPGSVILDVSGSRVVWAPLQEIDNLPHDLPTGQAGTITVYVAPPASGSANATIRTTTGSSFANNWLILDRIQLPAKWTRTNQGKSVWDTEYAVLRGTGSGELSSAIDADGGTRTKGRTYRRLEQTFKLTTDAIVSLHLSTTIRSTYSNGTTRPLSLDLTGSVFYRIYIDGILLTTVEQTISGFAETKNWEFSDVLSAGSHRVYVESSAGFSNLPDKSLHWEVVHGGTYKHRGDFLRVKHEGVSR